MHTIVKATQGIDRSNYIKIWRGQRYLTCRCLNCGQDFYTEEPGVELPEAVLTHDEIVDDEEELRAAEDELKKRTQDEKDRRCR
jgi:hypothetical protein